MLGNDDNSIEINVNKGGNGTSKGTVSIDISEYKALLKAKFDLEMVKDVLLNRAETDWSENYLIWNGATTGIVFRYVMGDAYDKKLEELKELNSKKLEELLNNKEDGE